MNNIDFYNNAIEESFLKTSKKESKLTNDILTMEGMSSINIRHFLNNLHSYDNINALQVGLWKGSTFISSLYKNNVNMYAMENWSEFDGPRNDFHNNYNRFIENKEKVNLYEINCFDFDTNLIKDKINIYFYDGKHDYESHYKAFEHFNNILDDVFICLVDDWTNKHVTDVRAVTYKAFSDLNYKIIKEWEKGSKIPNDYNGWWCGFYVAIIGK